MDETIRNVFLDESLNEKDRYEALFNYFVTGFVYHRSKNYTRAYYTGEPSSHGKDIDSLEGVTRVLPMIAAWVNSGRDTQITTMDSKRINLLDLAKEALIHGTDEKDSGYWGPIGDFDQKTCEAADVALSIWLLRSSLWNQLSILQREKVVSWLTEALRKRVTDNNWHLFPVVIGLALKSLGYQADDSVISTHYERMKSFYRGDGWFSDGPGEVYDYYNAWSIHYSLYWISLMDSEWDPEFLFTVSSEFSSNYQYFFGPKGLPVMGRSICYRLAAPAPLIATAIRNPHVVSPGLARNALNSIWRYFVKHHSLVGGNVTQGYCQKDLRFLDNYSGAASCLWSLRSLVLAYSCPQESAFWLEPLEPLPVEKNGYSTFIPSLRWEIVGLKERGEVMILKLDNLRNPLKEPDPYDSLLWITDAIRKTPHRPNNSYIKYSLPIYSSESPFCGCEAGL